jgi:hypothetical protein
MNGEAECLKHLQEGPIFRFCDWPNPQVPQVAAGVYTVWRDSELMYVGMAGRGLTAVVLLLAVRKACEVRVYGRRWAGSWLYRRLYPRGAVRG